ncbi:YidC/Oxa1 family membrane protein insertase [Peptostreptococcus stomatis]|uniref:Membrane protein insertase, YidC/Oxa1 family n=1 Tax=Peptostreptococcus stomatis DSM 17678 TaxID=596315 RepID=E0E1M4_9FIRM|nr:YidC/Oxa1 family membrane protein insertase [Peptostreptococcus stomatis]EFM65197.1 membrane protein insertase, YidC/Oxa1 family [Peptostreptococcus stomatis DSM 17678]MBL6464990.1 membrane protein insertase YidC [Peptostreptococcus stomatis]
MGQIASLFGIALKAIYGVIGNYGLSIIVFTIIVKMILMPLTVKQTKSTFAMSEINPKVKEIQAKYKNKPEKQNEEISKLYKESGINPLSGCLPILIQMPILMGLFYVFKDPVTHGVFASKAAMAAANGNFLWIKALSKPDYILAVFSGVSAYLMQKVMTPKDQIEGPMKMMSWLLAGMSLYWGFIFPAALTLYWGVSNIFSVFQYYLITRPLKSKLEQEKADKEAGKSSFKKK